MWNRGCKVIPQLALSTKTLWYRKKIQRIFTDLDLLLRELKIDTVIMTGRIRICVRHTAADVHQLGYHVVVASDATDSFTEEDYLSGIEYLKNTYDAKVYTVDELCEMFAR